MKGRDCEINRYALSQAEKHEMIERLWVNWEGLNTEYQGFAHKKVLCEAIKKRKLEIEARMMQIEDLIDQLRSETVVIDKHDFKFE